ncbi:MAG: histidine phosphatase family protein [Candidatus Dojkabacteria bacterium]|nr:histidine phosphatase family protein [Candidatus Dojkabacteria bacterium]MDQ7020980.1 histidine phosphatase family protein [Candidatus Dojkabacteria bacterium]
MTTIFLQRHGIYSNPRNIMPLRMPDISLAIQGIKQIKELCPFYKELEISAIYASPINRILETVDILQYGIWEDEERNEKKVDVSLDLIEPYSPLQGLRIDEYYKLNNGTTMYVSEEHIAAGGETLDSVYTRMNKFISSKLKEHKNESFIICSHGDPMMIYSMKKRSIEIDPNVSLHKQANFIPMGGAMKLKFDDANELVDFEELNY